MNKIGCIVQARMTSSRLPGKVLKTLDFENDTTILENVIEHLKKVSLIDQIIVATTINDDDDPVEEFCRREGISVFRGSEKDVLERYYFAAKENSLDDVIRITSDCPFIDPNVLTDLIDMYLSGKYDYVSNGQTRTYPHGLDCEIFSFEVLEKVHSIAEDMFYREHVTSYIYTHPDEFKLGELVLTDEDYSNIRITVDTEKDYAVCCAIKSELGDLDDDFRHIVDLYERKPYLKLINKDIIQKKKYDSLEDELQDAVKILDLQELYGAADILKEKLKHN